MSTVADKSMSTMSYAGGGLSVISGLTLTEWGIVIGILTALLTFAANIVYQVRKDKREKRLNDLEVEMLIRHGSKKIQPDICAAEK
ncbi:HP1 family phage holin [Pseudomonas sp. S9]|uniref:HP1 family phage holin n=1 Tax=Pseudomonas sp. S9 TaxID=686578 RepID=UPI0002556DEC|nr:HP1 family phage holin [Pseudomonas sp. S9]